MLEKSQNIFHYVVAWRNINTKQTLKLWLKLFIALEMFNTDNLIGTLWKSKMIFFFRRKSSHKCATTLAKKRVKISWSFEKFGRWNGIDYFKAPHIILNPCCVQMKNLKLSGDITKKFIFPHWEITVERGREWERVSVCAIL